jgi:hypothetical protein
VIYATAAILVVMLGVLLTGLRIVKRSDLADPSDRAMWSNPRSFSFLEITLCLQAAVGTLAALRIGSTLSSDYLSVIEVAQFGAIAVAGLAAIPVFRRLRARP